jgi:ATPase family protein associated with various cellular activities (AAA)
MMDYLNLMTCDSNTINFSNSNLGSRKPEGLGKDSALVSCDPIYRRDISNAISVLDKFFKNNKTKRPLNSIIMGPPGSGKSFLAKQISEACNAVYVEENISQKTSPQEVIALFDTISKKANEKTNQRLVVLIDEFDVRIGGVAAVQYLISPIYDREDLRNVAFLFSGSYIKNVELLGVGLNNRYEFDYFAYLFDYHIYLRSSEYGDESKELQNHIDLVSKLEQRAHDRPDSNVLAYIQSLEKLLDFRSRINGFTIEIPAIDSPLDLTHNRYQLAVKNEGVIYPNAISINKIIEFVDASDASNKEGKYSYKISSPWQVFVDYQDSIIRERLSRVGFIINERFFGKKKNAQLKIKRGILNYLVVAPLFHGMRSLEFIINELKNEHGFLDWDKGMSDERLAMHIRDYHEFKNWTGIWNDILQTNRVSEKIDAPASGYITLVF